MNQNDRIKPEHPGEIIKADWLVPLNKSVYWLAKGIGMQETAVSEILNGKRGVTPNTALRLSRFLGLSPETWLGYQGQYDLHKTYEKSPEVYDGIERYDAK